MYKSEGTAGSASRYVDEVATMLINIVDEVADEIISFHFNAVLFRLFYYILAETTHRDVFFLL